MALVLAACSTAPAGREPSAASTPARGTTAPAAPSATPATTPGTDPSAGPPPLATLYGDGHSGDHGSAKIEVIALERSAPDAVTARFRISAEQSEVRLEGFHASGLAGSTPYDHNSAFSGFYLLDDTRFSAYYPMKSPPARCLCSQPEPFAKVRAGESALMWAVYRVPPDTTGVAVGFHGAGLTPTLPIAPAGGGGTLDGEPDAAAIAAATPNTIALATRTDGTGSSVTESGERIDIALDTDVLFDFDKATLTGRARRTLQGTAERIRAEADGEVRVVGHTDDVGSDAYNQGLSLRRARAVEKALRGLVPDAEFATEGKGETDPAEKGTSDGARARNRRVEVAFPRKAVPPPPAASPSAVPAPAPSEAAAATARGLRKMTGLTANLLELRRVGGRTLVATVELAHTGGGEVTLEDGAWDGDVEKGGFVYGYKTDFFWLALADRSGTRYLPMTTPGDNGFPRHCVCSEIVFTKLRAGERIRMSVLMTAPPPGVTSVDVEISGFTPMRDVPVTG
ncbi:OmpA family protein [Streptosporangium sp. NPDC004379]|uniref:OmpA family protein n=1 Tax=Streptosporangium sp. NPDC004379 TaxID=3366189 RepID=UPI0036C69E57